MGFYPLLIALTFSGLSLFGQTEEGYFTKDSVSNVGFNVTLFSPAQNAQYCHIQYDKGVKNTPPKK